MASVVHPAVAPPAANQAPAQFSMTAFRTLLVLTAVQHLLWAPQVLLAAQHASEGWKIPDIGKFFIIWLGQCNTYMDFFIYSGTQRSFRRALRSLCRDPVNFLWRRWTGRDFFGTPAAAVQHQGQDTVSQNATVGQSNDIPLQPLPGPQPAERDLVQSTAELDPRGTVAEAGATASGAVEAETQFTRSRAIRAPAPSATAAGRHSPSAVPVPKSSTPPSGRHSPSAVPAPKSSTAGRRSPTAVPAPSPTVAERRSPPSSSTTAAGRRSPSADPTPRSSTPADGRRSPSAVPAPRSSTAAAGGHSPRLYPLQAERRSPTAIPAPSSSATARTAVPALRSSTAANERLSPSAVPAPSSSTAAAGKSWPSPTGAGIHSSTAVPTPTSSTAAAGRHSPTAAPTTRSSAYSCETSRTAVPALRSSTAANERLSPSAVPAPSSSTAAAGKTLQLTRSKFKSNWSWDTLFYSCSHSNVKHSCSRETFTYSCTHYKVKCNYS
uniref:G-protein coupled receptors family 1 profile domain-containing protein n=1 Tax=Branchiostoma floridae TaxID=7739 RepID=C3ZA88_BRAFL|eukprot:XP_002594470.1 hypothetical protein BRAFLDRAFT_87659 [Branchiostoma floridae]